MFFPDPLIVFGARYLVFLLLGAVLLFFMRLPPERKREFLFYASSLLLLGYGVGLLAAFFYPELRPPLSGGPLPLVPLPPTNSFPSDHTLFSALAGFSVLRFNRGLGVCFLIIALVIGISRVFAGVHYPLDILGGFAIAALVAALLSFLFNWHARS